MEEYIEAQAHWATTWRRWNTRSTQEASGRWEKLEAFHAVAVEEVYKRIPVENFLASTPRGMTTQTKTQAFGPHCLTKIYLIFLSLTIVAVAAVASPV